MDEFPGPAMRLGVLGLDRPSLNRFDDSDAEG
jgi:hypothetical protein